MENKWAGLTSDERRQERFNQWLSPEVQFSSQEAARAYRRVYHAEPADLLDAFQKEMRYPRRKSLTLTEVKEFTYWLFKYRVKTSEKSRIASDTKKALALMYRKMSGRSV